MAETTPLLTSTLQVHDPVIAKTTSLLTSTLQVHDPVIIVTVPENKADISIINNKPLKAIIHLIVLFIISTVFVYLTLKIYLPPLDENQKQHLHLPRGIEDLRALNKILNEYMDRYHYQIMLTYSVVYVYLQTFSVPGSMWLSILGGALFSMPIALLLICSCAGIGSSNCYLLSKAYGKSFVKSRFRSKLDAWSRQLDKHSHHLLNYMIIVRISPLPPHWFINIAAPHVGVPLIPFFLGTFFGVLGHTLIYVQAGMTISDLTSDQEFTIFSWKNVGALALIAVAVMIPVWIRKRAGIDSENYQEIDHE
ncbi:16925_t:CDS:2 [Dentiscutata heterogama]|uniref:16925_t:CDS:1 n=1 Tax=Dentiscutata heterogama TaxID=1316150 RepID=A0ACA9LM03_9GLOM|nr:16925_t:CDS:2 [Dentiscutata heterogama]